MIPQQIHTSKKLSLQKDYLNGKEQNCQTIEKRSSGVRNAYLGTIKLYKKLCKFYGSRVSEFRGLGV